MQKDFINKNGCFAMLWKNNNGKYEVFFCKTAEKVEFETEEEAVKELINAGYERKVSRGSVHKREV